MIVPDNFDIWEAHDIEMERRRMRLPECACCGEHIQQEDAVCINGDWYCDSCLDEMRFMIEVDE